MKRHEAVQPAISCTNRQIRKERLPIFYHQNKFKYHLHDCDFGYLIDYMNTIGISNCKNIRDVTIVIKDRLSCGKGLHDFVRWCAQSEGADNMIIEFRAHDWFVEYLGVGTVLGNDGTEEHTEAYCRYGCRTMQLLTNAMITGQELRKQNRGTTTDLQARQAWECGLHEIDLQCGSCDRQMFSRGVADNDMEHGHCSDMCRYVEFGTACNEVETEADSWEGQV